MYDYGEFCPIAKASQILCERWTLLILREMLHGATRFNEIRRYLPRISPSLLKSRLQSLEAHGVAIRVRVPEQRGHEYHLTPAGRELESVMMTIGAWALRWQYASMEDAEIVADTLMRDLTFCIDITALPRRRTVVRVQLTDPDSEGRWYIVIDDDRAEVCDEERALDADVYLTSDRRTLNDMVLGIVATRDALAGGRLLATGAPNLLKGLGNWFAVSPFADVRQGDGRGMTLRPADD